MQKLFNWIRLYAHNALFAGFVPLTGKDASKVELTPFFSQAFQSGNIADFVNAAFRAALAIGAMLAVLRIAYGGFIYMTKDSFPVKQDAKEIIQNAVFGLLLLLAIWVILNQINPNILKLDVLRNVTPAQQNTLPGGVGSQPY